MHNWTLTSDNTIEEKICISFRIKNDKNDDSATGEIALQTLIFNNPKLFPVSDFSKETSKWIPLAQEVRLTEGRIDILATDSAANIYILECKLYDNRDLTTIRSQIDNYAAGIWNEIEKYGIDSFWESFCDKIKIASKLNLKKILENNEEDSDEIMNSMKKNLEQHKIYLVFVVDRITPNLRTSINWWNNRMDPEHNYQSFALEINQYGENGKNPSHFITQLFPYDYTEIIAKGVNNSEKRDKGTIGKWEEQVNKNSELNETDKKAIFEFKEGLEMLVKKESDSYLDFGTGQTVRLMPKFKKYLERSPIGILSNGTLKFMFGLISNPEGDPKYAIAEQKFREKIIEIESLKLVQNNTEPGVKLKLWLPYKDKILSILEEVFIKE